jgi:hypothetical protein
VRLATDDYPARHLRFGWWTLCAYAALGLILEALHGFKVAAYLDVSNDMRRLMWRLAHTHGTLLAAINILFALTLRSRPAAVHRGLAAASALLIAATVILPGGFLLGGVVFYGGDPGISVVLVPIGGVLLLAALWMIARAMH